MRRSFSVASALVVVAVAGAGMALMRSGSMYGVSAVAFGVLTLLSVSVTGALFLRGYARVFWTGFAVFGWVYMLLIHNTFTNTKLAEQAVRGLHVFFDNAWPLPPVPPSTVTGLERGRWYGEFAVQKVNARVIFDLYLNLAFATLGGLTALGFAWRSAAQRRAVDGEGLN